MSRNIPEEPHISERCAQEVCAVIFNELSARGRFKDADDFSAALDKAMEDVRPIMADFFAEAGAGRAAAEPEAKCGTCGGLGEYGSGFLRGPCPDCLYRRAP